MSQEDQSGTHKSQRDISRDLNVSRTSVRRMTTELNLRPFKRIRTQTHFEQVVPHFIKKDEWPPQSLDLNPMDYTIWDSLSEKVYKGRTQKFTENELKEKSGRKSGRKLLCKKSGSQSGHSKRDLGLCMNRTGVTSITFSTEIGR